MYSKILIPIGSPAANALRGKTKLVRVENGLFTDYTLAPPIDDQCVLQAVRIEA